MSITLRDQHARYLLPPDLEEDDGEEPGLTSLRETLAQVDPYQAAIYALERIIEDLEYRRLTEQPPRNHALTAAVEWLKANPPVRWNEHPCGPECIPAGRAHWLAVQSVLEDYLSDAAVKAERR